MPPDYSPYLVPLKTYMGEDIASYEENMMVHPLAGEALATMLTQANNDGVRGFIINSVYRPIDMQQQLWSARLEKDPQYGSEPKSFPVKVLPGNMSEHPTGLAIAVLVSDKPNAVKPYPFDGNDLLHGPGDIHALPVLLQYAGECFNHRVRLRFSFSSFSVCSDTVRPAYRVACSQSLRQARGNTRSHP